MLTPLHHNIVDDIAAALLHALLCLQLVDWCLSLSSFVFIIAAIMDVVSINYAIVVLAFR